MHSDSVLSVAFASQVRRWSMARVRPEGLVKSESLLHTTTNRDKQRTTVHLRTSSLGLSEFSSTVMRDSDYRRLSLLYIETQDIWNSYNIDL